MMRASSGSTKEKTLLSLSECQRMTELEKELMERYEITCEQNTVYYYMGYKYERLQDALKYAEIQAQTRSDSVR